MSSPTAEERTQCKDTESCLQGRGMTQTRDLGLKREFPGGLHRNKEKHSPEAGIRPAP